MNPSFTFLPPAQPFSRLVLTYCPLLSIPPQHGTPTLYLSFPIIPLSPLSSTRTLCLKPHTTQIAARTQGLVTVRHSVSLIWTTQTRIWTRAHFSISFPFLFPYDLITKTTLLPYIFIYLHAFQSTFPNHNIFLHLFPGLLPEWWHQTTLFLVHLSDIPEMRLWWAIVISFKCCL